MKLIYMTRKHKMYNLKHAIELQKRSLIHNSKLVAKRQGLQGKPKSYDPEKFKRKLHKKAKKHPINAPSNFSLIGNTKEFVTFINQLELRYEQKHEVYIEMKDIVNISIDAISVLLSCLAKFKENGIYFEGSFPQDPNCKNKIIKSGFFDYVGKSYENMVENNGVRLRGKQDVIITHGSLDVLQALSADVILEANRHIHGEKRRNFGIQSTLIELMTNTGEHASGSTKTKKEWWMSIEKTENPKTVRFSFIDYGIGIFNSLNKKGFLQILRSMLSNQSNSECLREIFEHQTHKTSIGESSRGKGLPEIKENLDNNSFSCLRVLTNDVFADVTAGQYNDLDYHFNGTFFYFELTKENNSYEYRE